MSKSAESGVKSFAKDNPEVLKATIIVIGSFVVVEILAEFIMAIIWTANAKHHFIGFTVFIAAIAYYGPGIFSVYKVIRKCHLYIYRKKEKMHDGIMYDLNVQSSINEGKCNIDIEEVKIDTLFKCFVWITAYFAYVILYSFFPAFVLAFAYPTRVITIFAFMATFLVLSIVYLTTYIKKGVTLKILKDIKNPFIVSFTKVIISIILIILLLYFFLLIFALLYALVIGRASVVSSAPLAVLSLLPSILISIAAWVMKSTMLKNDNDTNSHGKNDVSAKRNRKNMAQMKSKKIKMESMHKMRKDMEEKKWKRQVKIENLILKYKYLNHATGESCDNKFNNKPCLIWY